MMPVLAPIDAVAWSRLTQHIRSIAETSLSLTFEHLKRPLAESKEHNNTNNVSFYPAVSDRFFSALVNSSAPSGRSNNRSKRGGA